MRIVSASVGLAIIAAADIASADVTTPPAYIESVVFGGTGCGPESETTATIADDGSGFRLEFHDFVAKVGDGVDASESRKNCQASVTVRVPDGYAFALASFASEGDAVLAPGARAFHQTMIYFQGQAPTAVTTYRLFDGPWRVDHVVPVAGLAWSPCGVDRALNINTSVRIMAPPRPDQPVSTVAVASTDSYRLVLKACSN